MYCPSTELTLVVYRYFHFACGNLLGFLFSSPCIYLKVEALGEIEVATKLLEDDTEILVFLFTLLCCQCPSVYGFRKPSLLV